MISTLGLRLVVVCVDEVLLVVDGLYDGRLVLCVELTLERNGVEVEPAVVLGVVATVGGCVDISCCMQRGRALLHWPVAKQVSTLGPSKR